MPRHSAVPDGGMDDPRHHTGVFQLQDNIAIMNLPITVDNAALLRLTVVAQHPPLGCAVLRCLSMTNVVVTQASDIAYREEHYPDAFVLFADDYPPSAMVEFVRHKLSRATVRAITLVTEYPRDFDALLNADEAPGRLAIVPQLVSGGDLLDLVFGLTARLTSGSHRTDHRVGA